MPSIAAICGVGHIPEYTARHVVDGSGIVLSPGFIDSHTHDDINVIRTPEMLPKLSQGVTTVIVGNCGISAAPVELAGEPPDPMNLLGDARRLLLPNIPVVYCGGRDGAAGSERCGSGRPYGVA